MATFVIESDLGLSYWLRRPDAGENLTGKFTVDLSEDEFAAYEAAQRAHDEWSNRLGRICRDKT